MWHEIHSYLPVSDRLQSVRTSRFHADVLASSTHYKSDKFIQHVFTDLMNLPQVTPSAYVNLVVGVQGGMGRDGKGWRGLEIEME